MTDLREFTYDGETIVVGDTNWKECVLSVDPFDGDIGGGSNLTDKIVKTRKTQQLCSDCLSICEPNKYSRIISSSVDGQLLTNRYCQECCTAMAFDGLHHDYKQYDDENEDYPEEEIMLSDVRQDVRTRNEKILIKALGKRYFDNPKQQIFQVMIEVMTEQTFKIQPVDVPNDLNSNWFHPDIAKHDTISDGAEHYTQEQWEQLKKNLGVDIIYDTYDYQDIPEIPEEDCADWSKWQPVPLEEGLFLIAAYDTEDGPVLWWAKEKEEG